MSAKVRKKSNNKQRVRLKHRMAIRSKIMGTEERPRLCVFRSNKNLFVQIIDDVKEKTLVSASSLDEEFKGKGGSNIDSAKAIGQLVAKRAIAKKVEKIVFDRSGYVYHGRVKALAEGAREGGLKF